MYLENPGFSKNQDLIENLSSISGFGDYEKTWTAENEKRRKSLLKTVLDEKD